MSSTRVLISGASGLIGSLLVPYLKSHGYEVVTLRRSRESAADSIFWDPESGTIEKDKLYGFDAVINLAGENIAARRWNASFKKKLYDSRVRSTEFLIESLEAGNSFPHVFVSASAVGFYGETGEQEIDEDRPAGSGFLAEICRGWESAARRAEESGARVVSPRFGVVLSRHGGALAKMLPVFRLGLGGRIGSGQQWMSWISSCDLCAAFKFMLENESVRGAVNLTSPLPVRNAEFTRTLAAVLKRTAVFPFPAFMARLVFGELADETLLRSTKAVPARLLEHGLLFKQAKLSLALMSELTPNCCDSMKPSKSL